MSKLHESAIFFNQTSKTIDMCFFLMMKDFWDRSYIHKNTYIIICITTLELLLSMHILHIYNNLINDRGDPSSLILSPLIVNHVDVCCAWSSKCKVL